MARARGRGRQSVTTDHPLNNQHVFSHYVLSTKRDLVTFVRRGQCSEVSEAVLSLAPNERVIRNSTTPTIVPSEPTRQQTWFDSSSDLILQCHSQMCFSSGCGAPSGQHIAAAQACCWLWHCMPSTQRSSAVVYQPRHHPTNEMHTIR